MSPHRWLQQHQSAIGRLLGEMVQIPTVNPPGQCYREMVDWLASRCQSLGMHVAIHRVPDDVVRQAGVDVDHPRYNLVARQADESSCTVHFNGHYDVVPAGPGWRSGDPFWSPPGADWLYGRGAGDMKGSIAALLAAIEALRCARRRPAFNVECSFTADEETGGELGAGYLVDQGLLRADWAVVCEGSSGTEVGCGHNGVLWLEVRVEGRSAHASSPERGANAFEGMAELVSGLQDYRRSLSEPSRRYRDFGGQVRNPTMSVGGAFGGGGQKVNTVPGEAWFTIDRRLVPGERLPQVEREARQAVAAAAGRGTDLRYHVRRVMRLAPCVVAPDHELPRAFARSVRAVRRRPVGYRVSSGFSDLHHFVEAGKMAAIGYGVEGQRAHGADERVRLRDVVQVARVYADFMLRGMPSCDGS